MSFKRVNLFAAHYGSGKTNIAVNFAIMLNDGTKPVKVYDLDIVNPYFRTKDSMDELNALNIPLIASPYANSNVDIPALPSAMYEVIDNKQAYAIVDVGGDDRGATALGRLTEGILKENDYDMFYVANFYRPLSSTPEDTFTIIKEIETASGLKFTKIINNSNLAEITTAEDIIKTHEKAVELSKLTGLPIAYTTVREDLAFTVKGHIDNVFPLRLQHKYF